MSIFDIDSDGNQRTDTLPDPKTMRSHKTIALHHGSVGTYQYDNGFEVKDDRVTNETFKGYDLVLLGITKKIEVATPPTDPLTSKKADRD